MRTERAWPLIAAALLLAAPAGSRAQTPPAPVVNRAEPKPPAPPPAPAPSAQRKPPVPAKPAPPLPAPPKPAPPKAAPPKPAPPKAHPEDDAIIEQLELFMLMEMLKDYEILREPEK